MLASATSLQHIAGQKLYMRPNLLRVCMDLCLDRGCLRLIRRLGCLGMEVRDAQHAPKYCGHYNLQLAHDSFSSEC